MIGSYSNLEFSKRRNLTLKCTKYGSFPEKKLQKHRALAHLAREHCLSVCLFFDKFL